MQPPQHQVLVVGAGAAGAAAARELTGIDTLAVRVVEASSPRPYNRTLVNKAIATGLISAEQASMPALGAPTLTEGVALVDLPTRQVRTRSGATLRFDSLVVATGSLPRRVDATIPGARDAERSGRLTTLHSLTDAVRVRDILTGRHARVVILGAGLVGAETASLLAAAGHDVHLVARGPLPGATTFGDAVAAQIAEQHRSHLSAHFGRTVAAFTTRADTVNVVLDDGHVLDADLVIAALGTLAAAPAPWTGPVHVDERLHVLEAPGVLAAGGVAVHHDPRLGTWRIDHWADATAQGAHAAAVLLHDLGLRADPGPYLPQAMFAAQIHGRTLTGVGLTHGQERIVSSDPLVVVHQHDTHPVGAIGLDAPAQVHAWTPQLDPVTDTAA